MDIMDREIKQLKRSRIPIIKVRWNSKRGPEFTWEHEDKFKQKYPQLFAKTAPSSSVASYALRTRIQAARDRQKSYADLKRKPMDFQVGDKVMLK
nr:putative reverse transcriptase domain-containing protein [Tanacetum cinerariifolium]